MNWITARGRLIHIIIWLLFIVSLLGPWTYDLIFVPAKYTCTGPNIRLEGDFCGLPLSGFFLLSMFAEGLIGSLGQPIADTFFVHLREFLVVLFMLLILLPFFSTLCMIWIKQTRPRQVIHLVIWAVASILPVRMFLLEWNNIAHPLWGLRLYILIAIGSILSEIFLLRSNTIPGVESGRP